jgi:lysosomal Pro-X carboxypeptidase
MDPPYNFDAFNIGVTYDASAAGGSSDRCKDNLQRAWDRILAAGQTADGRAKLTRGFRTCSPVQAPGNATDDPWYIMQWAQGPWANMAMGNFPYASSYLMHGKSMLPPWPVRAACSHLDADLSDDEALFNAVRAAVAVQYNNTGDKACFDIVGDAADLGLDPPPGNAPPVYQRKGEKCTGDWDFQWCTEMVQPFLQGTRDDMFWCSDGTYYPKDDCSFWNFTSESDRCFQQWGVRPRKDWARVALAGKNLKHASNIVFTNGLQDPWHGGGVLQNISETVVSVIIPNGAHHIDLMFSDPADKDYPDILHARQVQVEHMHRWVSVASGLVLYI